MENKNIGSFLKSLRMENNLTLKEAAKKLEIDFTFLSKIENNKYSPSENLIKKTIEEYSLDSKKELELYLLAQASDSFKEVLSELPWEDVKEVLFRTTNQDENIQ